MTVKIFEQIIKDKEKLNISKMKDELFISIFPMTK